MAKKNNTENNMNLSLPPELPGLLLKWYDHNARALPWRLDNDPYRVWVSEIMLQQTGVEVVARYYPRFLEAFPTIGALAAADAQALMKQWEGLGYYARARNLQKAARLITEQLSGSFPETYEAIRALPGIGDYTAGAISSICFELPEPAVDGNVARVVSRLSGIREALTDTVKKRIVPALRDIYPQVRRGDFTQSLMELGAVVCLPKAALKCDVCPLAALCAGRRDGSAASLPVKAKKQPKKQQELTVFLLSRGDDVALLRREEKGLLGGLWELPNVPGHLDEADAVRQAEHWGVRPARLLRSFRRSHIFTHIRWDMLCYVIECAETAAMTPDSSGLVWAGTGALRDTVALPTAFRKLVDAAIGADAP